MSDQPKDQEQTERERIARMVDDYAGAQRPTGTPWAPWESLCEDEQERAYAVADEILRLSRQGAEGRVT